jgi:hypothetical protein
MIARNAACALLVLTVTATQAEGAGTELRWKFQKERPYRFEMSQDLEVGVETPDGRSVNTKVKQRMGMTWAIRELKPDGSAVMTQTIGRIKIDIEGPAGRYELDSDRKDANAQEGPLALIGKLYDALVGTPIEVTISARGETLSVKVPDKVAEATKQGGPIAQALGGAFTEKGFRQLMEQSSIVLPEKPVTAGATWQQKRSIETAGLGPLEVDTTYRLKGDAPGKPGVVEIDSDSTMVYHPREGAPFEIKVKSQEIKGAVLFDNEAGCLRRSEVNQKMVQDITGAGQSIHQTIKQSVILSLSE